MTTTTASTGTRRSLVRDVTNKIAWDLDHALSTGDVAELRRTQPGDVGGAAYWRLMLHRVEPVMDLPESGAYRVEQERRWATILSMSARLAGLHSPGRPLGAAMQAAGVTEARLTRVLRARGEPLYDALRSVCHQLESGAHPADLADIALLVLSDGQADEEFVRRRIARDYYRHENREEQ